MFTKEKIINYNIINSTLNFINNESDVMFPGEIMMYVTNHFLTYDESCYLYEHINFINSDDYKNELIYFVNEWKVIIDDINKSLDNGTIIDYLSNFKGIRVMSSILGLQREGVELTDRGNKLLFAINNQLEKLDEKMDILARNKGFVSYKHLLLSLSLPYEHNFEERIRIKKLIEEEIAKKKVLKK